MLASSFLACTSPQKKAEKLIEKSMKETLKDPSSYEPVSFSELDSVFSPYSATEEGKELSELGGPIGRYQKIASEFRKKGISAETTFDEFKAFEDSADYYEKKAEEMEVKFKENEKKYKGEFIGWYMRHNYRAKNSFGAILPGESRFFFNKELTEIVAPNGATKEYLESQKESQD